MRPSETNNDSLWLLILVPIGVACLLGIFLIPWAPIDQWAGDKPPVEVFALLVTPLGALAGVAGLFLNAQANRRSLEQGRRIQIATNFQRGAEMLTSSLESSRVAGMEVLRQVAAQDASNYWRPVTNVLAYFIEERTGSIEQFKEQIRRNERPEFDIIALHALTIAASVADRAIAHDGVQSDIPPIEVNRVAITNFRGSCQLSWVHVSAGVINVSLISDSNLSHLTGSFYFGKGVVFTKCNFHGAVLVARLLNEAPVKPEDVDYLQFTDCTGTDTATNDMRMDEWITRGGVARAG